MSCNKTQVQYIPQNMHIVGVLLCIMLWFGIGWFYPYPSGLLHWHCGSLMIATVPVKQPWRIWVNRLYEPTAVHASVTTAKPSIKPCTYFTARSREVSKPRDSGLNFSNRSEIWQVPRQRCCRGACQISERYDHCNIQSRGFETSRDLAVRRLTA